MFFSSFTFRSVLLVRSLLVSSTRALHSIRDYNFVPHRYALLFSTHSRIIGQPNNYSPFMSATFDPMPPKRVSSKMSSSATATDGASNNDDESKPKSQKGAAKKAKATADEKEATKKKKAPPKLKAKCAEESVEMEPKKRKSGSAATSSVTELGDDSTANKKKKSSPNKKAKASDHQRWTERMPLPRLWDPESAMKSKGSYTFTVISWNVAGLRAFVTKQPDALANLANKYHADVICLQEHKLQDTHLDDPKLRLREHFEEKLEGFDSHWSFSQTKKGYSGTAMFIRKRGGGGGGDGNNASKKEKKQAKIGAFFTPKNKGDDGTAAKSESIGDIPVSNLQPLNVMTELGMPKHDGEGRTITAEFPLFYLTNVYVPNSGQKLDRLGYRTEEWDTDFLNKMLQLEKDGRKPIIWLGDLNVAHNEKDTWNEGAKHLDKSAGTTPQERASFDRQLSAGFVDAFRHLHQDAMGHYSYWSQRAGNREPNKGLRLDYFICSKDLMEDKDGQRVVVRDSYMVHDEIGSDHCPIVLEIEMKK